MNTTNGNAAAPPEEPLESLRDFASGWERFWFLPSDPTTIGLIRLLGGLVVLYSYFCYSFDLMSYVSPKEGWLDEGIVNELRYNAPQSTFPDAWPGDTDYFVVNDQALTNLRSFNVPESVITKVAMLRGNIFGRDETTGKQKDEAFSRQLGAVLSAEEIQQNWRWLRDSCRFAVPSEVEAGKGQMSWSIFFHLEQPIWLWTAHIVILCILFLFTIGFATRITSVLALMGTTSYIWRAQTSLLGMDAMIVVLMFYLMIAPGGAALSVDRWLEVRRERKRKRDPNLLVPLQPLASATFATRLFQIHFCFIYMAAGTSKLLGASWWNGNALWGCYANYQFAPMRIPIYRDFLTYLCQHRWLWELAMSSGALFTLFLELSFAYLIWIKRWRWIMLTGSVMLHTGIGLFMNLVTFSLLMLCLVLSFVPPEATKLFLSHVAENWRHVRQAILSFGRKTAPAPAR